MPRFSYDGVIEVENVYAVMDIMWCHCLTAGVKQLMVQGALPSFCCQYPSQYRGAVSPMHVQMMLLNIFRQRSGEVVGGAIGRV